MKKFLLATLLCLASSAYALEPSTVNRSSHIAAVNSTGYLAAGYLDKVVIGMATSGGVLEVFNTTASVYATASTLISSMSLATVGHRDFDDTGVRGLFWRASTNTNGVTIIYKQ